MIRFDHQVMTNLVVTCAQLPGMTNLPWSDGPPTKRIAKFFGAPPEKSIAITNTVNLPQLGVSDT